METLFKETFELIQKHQKIAVISHVRPDADAIGSTIGLGFSLQAMGKEVILLNRDPIPARFMFLKGAENIQLLPETPLKDHLVISVDCAIKENLGAEFSEWNVDINIDHHYLSNPGYAKINLVTTEHPSNASYLYEFLEYNKMPLNQDIASALYAGIITDCGLFQYPGVTPRTFEIAGKLVALGADPVELSNSCFNDINSATFKKAHEQLSHLRFEENGKLAFIEIPENEPSDPQIDASQLKEFLLESIRRIGSLKVFGYSRWLKPGSLNISLRSQSSSGVDVNKLANQFGGGGHKNASGITIKNATQADVERVIQALRETIK
jgi:phosphoesterase RecJ-like protein